MSMNRRGWVRGCALALALAVYGSLERSAAAQIADPGNFLYTQNPNASVYYHSYLVGYQPRTNGVIWDSPFSVNNTPVTNVFSTWINNALDPNGVAQIHDADFFFQECFGGGMISGLPSALGNIPWVAGSAATYAQTALATVQPAPGVQPQYASWSAPLVQQMFGNPGQTILADDKYALQNDFWGPNQGRYRETPQYASYNGGNALTLTDAPVNQAGGTHYGVIFVGDTSTLNQSMINVSADMVTTLNNAWKGQPYKIYVLYGDGGATANVTTFSGKNLSQSINALQATLPANESVQLRAGTPAQLLQTLNGLGNTANDQFLFFGFDHGGKWRQTVPVRRANTALAGAAAPAVTSPTWTDSFSLEDLNAGDDNPNPNGELIDTANEEDTAYPVSLTVLYQGLTAAATGTVDVLVNGTKLGSLDPTATATTLTIPTNVLQDSNSVEIDDNSGQNVNILEDLFDSGALPPEDDTVEAPEPASVGVMMLGAAMLLRRRRKA
jgi:hypothetical protein